MKPLLPITPRTEETLGTVTAAVSDFLAVADARTASTPHVEPFCGAAEIPFELELTNCILNDSNPHIINFYEQVKNGEFFRRGWLIKERTDQRSWSNNRNRFNRLIADGNIKTVEAAQLTFYLNHVCREFKFDQLGNLVGLYNLSAELPEVDWDAAATLMQHWELHNVTYSDLVVPENTPIVVNAPEIHSIQWGSVIWTLEEHKALCTWLDGHTNNKIILFHPRRPRPEVDELYAHWTGGNRVFHSTQVVVA
ncbi:MAG: DNA adenine methylase [Cyanobacteria bacterium P01_F01_bin.13]